MKIIVFLFSTSIFLSCGLKDAKLIRKEVQTNDITIKWYYYSYITSGSPDIVDVIRKGEKKELYKGTRIILDVSMNEDSIFLKLVHPSEGYADTKKVEDSVFGYKIVVDTTGVPTDLNFIPKGIKE